MATNIHHSLIWRLVREQEGAVSAAQLHALGMSRGAIRHRVSRGRLTMIWPGVYALGRLPITRNGLFMAAVLTAGEGAVLSHESAAVRWGIRLGGDGPIHVSIPAARSVCRDGIAPHRRDPMPAATTLGRLPLTRPAQTLLDLAPAVPPEELARASNEADRLGLVDHRELLALLESSPGRRGAREFRALLGSTRTDSDLERLFLALVARQGLPRPLTQHVIEGLRVDFYWPDLGLVVETDGLTYHRTPSQQAADRLRDQILVVAGITVLRFTNAQVRREPVTTGATLAQVVARLRQELE